MILLNSAPFIVKKLVARALAEEIPALATEEYIQKRAQRDSRKKFEQAVSEVPDAEPEEEDRIE